MCHSALYLFSLDKLSNVLFFLPLHLLPSTRLPVLSLPLAWCSTFTVPPLSPGNLFFVKSTIVRNQFYLACHLLILPHHNYVFRAIFLFSLLFSNAILSFKCYSPFPLPTSRNSQNLLSAALPTSPHSVNLFSQLPPSFYFFLNTLYAPILSLFSIPHTSSSSCFSWFLLPPQHSLRFPSFSLFDSSRFHFLLLFLVSTFSSTLSTLPFHF